MVALLGVVAVRGEGAQTPDVPPPSAGDVAADLTRQGVPAGVAMCRPPGNGQVPGDAAPTSELDRTDCDELNASLFQRREGGVLHVRTTREPRRVTELLNRSIHVDAAPDVQAIDAIMRIILNAVRGDGSAGAFHASGREGTLVTIRGGPTTFMQALDDVVRQVPGLVWLLTFTPQEGGRNFQIVLLGPPGSGGGTCVFRLPPDGSGSFCPP